MAGALDGLKVIDFGQYIAGPLASMFLADQGADVVRVDPPGGPRWDTPANELWNRGKRSLVLDLKAEEDQLTARDLVVGADVVVENFRPGVMDRLGLGHDAMLEANPSLVFCSLPGFARDDARSGIRAWEGVVQAAAAVPPGPGGAAVMSAVPVSSVYAAFLGVVSTVMALNSRFRDGSGQWIEMSLFDATLTSHGFRVQRTHNRPPLDDNTDPRDGIHGWMGAYLCKDGKYVFFHPGNKQAAAFVEVVGGTSWEGRKDRPQLIKNLFLTKTSGEWEQLGHDVGTEIVTFRTTAEWLRTAQARESGLAVEVDDPVYGSMLQPGVQVRLSRTPGAVRGPAPVLDADRISVLSELGSSGVVAPPALAEQSGSDTGPLTALDGVNVVELSLLLAGPTCGRTLAEFGASVTKLESPIGRDTPAAWVPSYQAFHVDVNRGKRSMILDLRDERGLDVFWRLTENADVLVQNFRPGAMESLGIGYGSVHARNPRLVYASINTYGTSGPWWERRGHEHVGQASTGMAERFGGEGVPQFQNVRAICDHGTGLMAAFAIGLALIERQRSGEGQHVTASLAATGAILQAPFAYDYDGRGEWDEPRGQGSLGAGPWQRLYRASDRWLFVGLAAGSANTFAGVPGLEGIDANSPDVESGLEHAFEAETASVWSERLQASGIGAHVVAELAELVSSEALASRGLIVTREHQRIGLVDQLAPTPRLSRTPVRIGKPATPMGSDARNILADCDLASSLGELTASGTVVLK